MAAQRALLQPVGARDARVARHVAKGRRVAAALRVLVVGALLALVHWPREVVRVGRAVRAEERVGLIGEAAVGQRNLARLDLLVQRHHRLLDAVAELPEEARQGPSA